MNIDLFGFSHSAGQIKGVEAQIGSRLVVIRSSDYLIGACAPSRKVGSGLAIEHCKGDFRFMARPLRFESSESSITS